MGGVCRRICQCYSCACCACIAASCILAPWYCCESFALSMLYCHGCFWSLCAPCWIDCSCQAGPLFDNWTKAIKYLFFAISIGFSNCVDSCYNSMKVIEQTCGEDGIKSYTDIIQHAQFMSNKAK